MIWTDKNGCQHCEATTWGPATGGQWELVTIDTRSELDHAFAPCCSYEGDTRVRLVRSNASSGWLIIGHAENFWRLLDDPCIDVPPTEDEERASAIDTDDETGEQWAEATALADIARGECGLVQITGIRADGIRNSDCAHACSCSVSKGDLVGLYRPSASHQWHIGGGVGR